MQDHQLGISRVVVYVRMQLRVPYGRAVYVVGNSEEIGRWDVAKAHRLTWTPEDIWRGSFVIPTQSHLQYKYVIASYDAPNSQTINWEGGSNRLLHHSDLETGQVYLFESWNLQKIKLQLVTKELAEEQEMFVIGNSVELGLWLSKRFMDKKKVVELQCGERKIIWSTTLTVEKEKNYIHYYYIRRTSKGDNREREPGRYLYFNDSADNSINFYNRMSVAYRPGEIKVVEYDNFDRFQISQITENLLVGAYPKLETDMLELKAKNVRAVLSLQSKKDLKAFSIDPEQLRSLYNKHGIRAYNIEILDMKLKDFVDRSQQAVRLLRQLVETYGTVYVHCTAGIYRSPQLVVLYLVQFEELSVEQAISFVKSRRPCAQPYLQCIELSIMRRMQEEEEQSRAPRMLLSRSKEEQLRISMLNRGRHAF